MTWGWDAQLTIIRGICGTTHRSEPPSTMSCADAGWNEIVAYIEMCDVSSVANVFSATDALGSHASPRVSGQVPYVAHMPPRVWHAVNFSRTADLNMLLYLVDPHVGCLLAILAVAAVLWALVAACLGLWRRVSGSRHAVHGGLPALLCGQPSCGCLFTLPPVSTSVQGRDARYRLPVWFYPFSGSEVVPRRFFLLSLLIYCR